MIERYHLHGQVDAYPDKDSARSKSILDKLRDWRGRNDAVWLAGNFVFWITLIGYALLFTEVGNEVASKLGVCPSNGRFL